MEKSFKPAMGYCIVQIVSPGMTAGGLHVPETAKHYKAVLVEASDGHWHNGGFIKNEALPGAQLVLNPDVQIYENVDLPEKYAITHLRFVAAFTPPAVQA